jgi:hypothetical protein
MFNGIQVATRIEECRSRLNLEKPEEAVLPDLQCGLVQHGASGSYVKPQARIPFGSCYMT